MRRIFIAAVATLVAGTAAFAQSPAPRSGAYAGRHVAPPAAHYVAPSPSARYGGAYAAEPGFLTPDREKALRECSELEQRTSPSITLSNMPFERYRACMYDRGQPE